ncbi:MULTISPECIES: DNA gyrase inhibitor YacG [Halobacteriovorax]|uniref:DNA gyrase inhibitor YacG n=1 Tax=Halobacteriovorax TaxID=1652133 RepID=UPI0018F61820|nr:MULTISPECIES: DNA gyrase inhibitor YacG [Halobacteriovorax]
MTKKLNVKCPECSQEFNYYESEFRPFCSEKCKMVDLGMWLTENYTVASHEPLSDSDLEAVIKKRQDEEDY